MFVLATTAKNPPYMETDGKAYHGCRVILETRIA